MATTLYIWRNSFSQFFVVVSFLCYVFLQGCSNPANEGNVHSNKLPTTKMANVPPLDSIYSFGTAKVQLDWNGDDEDGFVTGFRFRWFTSQPNYSSDTTTWRTLINTTLKGYINRRIIPEVDGSLPNAKAIPKIYHYLSIIEGSVADSIVSVLDSGKTLFLFGESVLMADVRQFQNPNRGTFIFDSRDSLNIHTFEVAAIDNKGAVDPTPARVQFGTPRIYPPDTRLDRFVTDIDTVLFNAQFLPPGLTVIRRNLRQYTPIQILLPAITETYSGLTVYFTGADSLSADLEYQYKVDSQEWKTTPPNTDKVTITASDCDSVNNGWLDTTRYHQFILRAKNQFQIVDDTPDTLLFRMRIPEFIIPNVAKRYLLIDHSDTLQKNSPSRENPSPSERINFFRTILNSVMQPQDILDTALISVGGSFPELWTLSKYNGVILTSEKKVRGGIGKKLFLVENSISYLTQYLNLGGNLIVSSWDMYNRAHSLGGHTQKKQFYSLLLHFNTDTSNITKQRECIGAYGLFNYPSVSFDTSKLASGGAMDSIVTGTSLGFGEVIYQFIPKTITSPWNGVPIGSRYIGPTYNVIYFGFPLYYVEQTTATEVMRKALFDINNN